MFSIYDSKWSKEVREKCDEYYFHFKDVVDQQESIAWIFGKNKYAYCFDSNNLKVDLIEDEVIKKLDNAIKTNIPIIAEELLDIKAARESAEAIIRGVLY